MTDFNTPMMKQYLEVKNKYKDCLLFFRMGDFYELFLEDAFIGAEVLDIALTSRSKGKDGRVPMAGVPYHAVDSYISKLVKAGFKVAICEQLSEPNNKGIVDRDVIRIITPGTVLDEKTLTQKEHNYIVSITKKKDIFGLAIADISTGLFQIHEVDTSQQRTALTDELTRLQASECILPEALYNNMEFLRVLKQHGNMNIYAVQESTTYISNAQHILEEQFGKQISLDGDLKKMKIAQEAAALLVGYLQYTQKNILPNCRTIQLLSDTRHMLLDRSTIVNLELFTTLRDMERKGTLIHFLDKTTTSMGGRLLSTWVKRPLVDKASIMERHDGVEALMQQPLLRESIQKNFHEISDIERILSRLSLGIGNARDLLTLKHSLIHILQIKKIVQSNKERIFIRLYDDIDPILEKAVTLIDSHIVEDPPFDIKSGHMIKRGINKELDEIHAVINENKSWLEQFEKDERQKSGISSLKVRFNKVFGFYIEISKANLDNVPERYTRKQTLVNGERFITEELKKREELILSGEERMQDIEFDIFTSVLKKVLEHIIPIQKSAHSIAVLDCLVSFSEIAVTYHYTRPTLRDDGEIHIIEGRHPVVEIVLKDDQFVPNNTHLDNENQLLVITGPNMAGKSVYLRHVAVIVLLAQIGSFVPAKQADVSIVDRIFVRSGASDMISEGLSTFMVEMVETAQILHAASSSSLVIMDEIGRGTSTYDGISIAWAVAEYLVKRKEVKPKTLFATHYHELQDLETRYPNQIKNFHMAVEEENGEPVFLYTLVSGGASHSFGVAVAKLAGLPDEIIKNAWLILKTLEKRDNDMKKSSIETIPLFAEEKKESLMEKRVREIDLNSITPIEALNLLAELKKYGKNC